MYSKQELIKEIQQLTPSEILKVHDYLQEIKKSPIKNSSKTKKGAERTREALKDIKTSLSGSIIEMRDERI